MFERIRRYFFEKRAPETGRGAAERELRGRMAPLRGLDPDRLASAIDGFRAGSLGPLARVVAEFELRDDTMKSCSRKMRAAAARCPHQVLIREGVGASDRGRAEEHRRALEGLWARARATDALVRNQRGGFRLLLKQMMDAQSFGFAAHELVWRPRPDGSLDLTLVRVPLQFFESRTGALRYLRDPNLWEGEEMAEGEWMVTAGDGVGIAASIAAMGKRLSLQDWLLFSERCGQPGLHARTDAKQGSEQWENLVAAVANFGREWGIVTDRTTEVDTVTLANGGTPPYPGLVERMDRAIATLYRGSDLSTLSADGGSVGASQQGGEAEILEQDACEMLSETLQEQVERPFVRYVFGDDEPLAYIQVSPVSRPDLDMEMKIDQHLVSLGVALSKKEALERYQRTEASPDDPDDAALRQAQPPATGGFGLPNETPAPQKPRNGIANPLQNARTGSDVELPPPAGETRQNANLGLSRLADALGADMAPARDALLKLLDLPEAERPAAARELMGRLDELMPADPAMAAVLAEEMAAAFAEGAGEGTTEGTEHTEALENANRGKCPDCGQWLDGNGVCHECHAADEAAKTGENPDSAEVQAAEIGKGRAAIRRCLSEKRDVYDAVTRSDIGSISFIYGEPVDTEAGKAYGLAHLFEKHRGEGIVENLHTALVRGRVRNPGSSGNKIAIDHAGYQIHLAKTFSRKGNPTQDRVTWVITGFKTEKGDAD